LTSPVEWDPGTIDTSIPDDWYASQPKHNDVLRDGTLTELGALKEDLEADDTEDHSDRIRQAVDRGSIRAYLSSLIPDELGNGFILCEGEGTTHTVDYIPVLQSELSLKNDCSRQICFCFSGCSTSPTNQYPVG
jgi:hypothetical protein